MTTTQGAVDTLNKLLRGEIAATETYQQALAKVGTEPGADALRRIHDEHREAAIRCGSTSMNTAASRTRARVHGAPSPRR